MVLTDAWRKHYEEEFARMAIHPNKVAEAEAVAKKINANRLRYAGVSAGTNGVPWFLIGALHEREASCDFGKYLGDGEPLNSVTHCVPKGRGPFPSWAAGAIDALHYDGLDKITDWSLGSILFHAEAFNGEGYHDYHHMESPYVFAGSSVYSKGKYDRDGHFDPDLVDPQLGVAVILATMQKLGFIDLSRPSTPASTSKPTSTELPMADNTVNSAASAFGVLLSPILNILTHVFNSAGSILMGAGGSSLLVQLLDIHTGPLASIAAGSTLIGAILTGAAYYVSHTLVKGTNAQTVASSPTSGA